MPEALPPARLQGRRILVVEDDFITAEDLRRELEHLGAEVLGPVPDVAGALGLVAGDPAPDGALLDINLGGVASYPVADALRARDVPFVFVTGYDSGAIPASYADVPRVEKLGDIERIVRLLFGR